MQLFITRLVSSKSFWLLGMVLLLAIIFETSQQFYYIQRFDLAQNVQFWELFRGQSYRWLIWTLLAIPLAMLMQGAKVTQTLNGRQVGKYGLIIFGLVALNILIIAISQWGSGEDYPQMDLLFSEYIPFFTFQKAPVFTLGYIAIAFILYLEKINQHLSIEIKKMGELKASDQQLYQSLSKQIKDTASVLKIKIGNKHKIIPVAEIICLEADDYCVKIHSKNERTYSMRQSLKALEAQLPDNFLRVHRKYIANMDRVIELHHKPNPRLLLENTLFVPIAKSRLKSLKGFYTDIA